MSVGVLLIRGLLRNAEGNERNRPAAAVAQIVQSVRNERDQRGKDAEHDFCDRQQKIECDARKRNQASPLTARRFVSIQVFHMQHYTQ